MFTEIWFGFGLNFVINGCRDCPLAITDTPRDWCYLSKKRFGLLQRNNFGTNRPKSCKLPIQVFTIKFSPHSYSEYSEEELENKED